MIVLEITQQGRTRRISTEHPTVTIGKARSCSLRIAEAGVADRHCTLQLDAVKRKSRRGKKWTLQLVDHQVSDEPTRVNGIEVIKSQLSPGDIIQVGSARIRVVQAGAPGSASESGAATATPVPDAAAPTEPAARRVEPTHAPTTHALTTHTLTTHALSKVPAPPPVARRRTTTRTHGAVAEDEASPAMNRTLFGLSAGVVAALVVLLLLINIQPDKPRSDRTGRKSASISDNLEDGLFNPEAGRAAASGPRAWDDPTPGGRGGPTSVLARTGDTAPAEPDRPASSTPTAAAGPDRGPDAGPTGRSGRVAAESASGERLSRREVYLEALKADRMARENDFRAAAKHYRSLLGRTGAERLAGELEDRQVDLERLARARDELAARLEAATDARPEVVTRGRRVEVLGHRPGQGIVVNLDGEIVLPWKNVSPHSMAGLFSWGFPGAEGFLLRGLYLFEFKADFEKDPQLEEQCHAAFHRVLALEPSRIQEVNAILGRGLGVTSPRGFVYHRGRFMTPERRDRLAALAEAQKQLQNLSSNRAEVRKQAYAFLRQVNDLEMFQLFRKVLEARRRSLARLLAESPTGKKLLALRADKEKFLVQRKELVDIIFDTYNYPYPFRPGRGASQEEYQRYLASQEKIDDRARALWKVFKSNRGQVVLGKSFIKNYAVLREVQDELDKFKAADGVAPPSGQEWLVALGDLDYFKKRYRNKIGLAILPMDVKERRLVEYNDRVMAYNEALKSPATKFEKQQVEVTNAYRNLLGRPALLLNNKLLASARGHSRDMVLKGYFSHTAPDPERRTPQLRMKLAGYELRGGSENIARGASGPAKVHDRWCHSSGHHRNLLMPQWREMGSGNVGSFWTQNFGTRGLDLDQILARASGADTAASAGGKPSIPAR